MVSALEFLSDCGRRPFSFCPIGLIGIPRSKRFKHEVTVSVTEVVLVDSKEISQDVWISYISVAVLRGGFVVGAGFVSALRDVGGTRTRGTPS